MIKTIGGFTRDDATGALVVKGFGGPPRYLASFFGGDDTKGTVAMLATSDDGTNWLPYGPPVHTAVTPASLRDPCVIEYQGVLWMAYTHATFGLANTVFGLSKSIDGGLTWTRLTDVSVAGASAVMGGTIQTAWVDNWYIDDLGVPHLFLSVMIDPTFVGPVKRIETHPLDTTMTSWSAAVRCDSGLPTSSLDYSVTKIGSVYHGYFKDNTAERIVHATSSSYLGPWTVDNTDVFGMAQIEASNVFLLPDGITYRVTADHYLESPATGADQVTNPNADTWRYRFARSYYRDTTDFSTYTAVKELVGVGRFPRIRKIETVDISGLRLGARGSHLQIARASTGQSIPNGGAVSVATFDTVVEDSDGMFDLASRPSVAVVRVPGLYVLAGFAMFPAGAGAGSRFVQVTGNGFNLPGLSDKRPGVAGVDSHIPVSAPVRLRRGDELRVGLFQDSGGALVTSPDPAVTLFATRMDR